MSVISFYTNVKDQTGNTVSAISLATYIGIVQNKRVLFISTTLNSSEIKLPFHVRTKLPGDKMVVKNMSGSKKISDIFTDFKLSKEKRDTYPIVLDDTGEIIWIPGIKKSHLDRKKDKKYDIILKYDKREE